MLPTRPPTSPAPRLGLVVLAALTLAVLGLPAVGLGLDIARGLSSPRTGEWWQLAPAALARSAGWSSLIGLFAATLGLPIAWACRRTRSRWAGLLLAPALLPGFLAYSGWGMLRAPMSWTGAWIDTQRQAGWTWLPHAVDTTLAVGGLALWSAPIAAACMLPGARALSDDLLDAVRLEARGPRTLRILLPALAGPFLFAAAAIAALMLGSAIPLHLARVETAAISLWIQMDLTPPNRHWQVWLAGWPLALTAAAFAWSSSRMAARLGDAATASPLSIERRAPRPVALAALAVVALGSAAPLALYSTELKNASSIPRYWKAHHDALTTSAGLALLVAGAGVLLAAAVWHAGTTGSGRRKLLLWFTAVWTTMGLLPGVMAGAAVARGINLLASILPDEVDPSDSILPITAAHLARVGFLAVWLGLWLARSEARDARDARRLDGAESLSGWLPGTLVAGGGALGGLFAVIFALSLHEIEASVLTLWPGGSLLGRQLLNDLHFFRTEELASGVLLVAAALLPSAAAVAAAGALLRPARAQP